ncbi:MAG: sterol desaturase family protein [Deltaproteobacteria bacterium]|nr:sterol desaturase family protein [Deltaproteobacteria bacterium]
MRTQQLPVWVSVPLVVGAFAILLWLEHRRPLRPTVASKLTRTVRNLAVAAVGAAALQIAERPITAPLTAMVEQRSWGLLKWTSLPVWAEVPLAVVLLDYTLYVWHVLTHRVAWLWHFHVVHHVDLDLDASTALRFHFGELVLSVAWRAGQVVFLGVSPLALSVWQTAVLLSILFHHSNVRLSVETERWLNRFIVTPRMHGIHHSMVREETNANWSSGLTLWDRLHGTLRLNVPQDEITIGVPAYRESQEVVLPKILMMPFGKERPTWRLPNGEQPTRSYLPIAPDYLLA